MRCQIAIFCARLNCVGSARGIGSRRREISGGKLTFRSQLPPRILDGIFLSDLSLSPEGLTLPFKGTIQRFKLLRPNLLNSPLVWNVSIVAI
jgi:hypothetical protein